MKKLFVFVLFVVIFSSYGPPNCNLYKENEGCYQACKEAEKAIMHPQGSRKSQEHFDRSIALCPSFDYSYYEKAVPYAKRGLIKEWKEMIDKAVEINPVEHLANRGWYHFFFMHNYEAAIQDIEQLDALVSGELGYTGDGLYHLNIMLALCWKGLGETSKAIEICRNQIEKDRGNVGLYDYLHLGVLYLENREYNKAIATFQLQINEDGVSELYYYRALCYKALNQKDLYESDLETALKLYQRERSMSNPYRQLVDEIFIEDIRREMGKN